MARSFSFPLGSPWFSAPSEKLRRAARAHVVIELTPEVSSDVVDEWTTVSPRRSPSGPPASRRRRLFRSEAEIVPRLVPPVIAAGSIACNDQPTLVVEGGVQLRPWEAGDAQVLMAAFADPEIQRWHLLRIDSLDEAEKWIADTWARWQTETVATWAIAGSDRTTVLGRLSLYFHDLRNGIGEVTYWVVPEVRRGGLASRAVVAACEWALGPVGMHRIDLAHSIDNPASCRVAEKAGFLVEGIRRSALLHQNGWHDIHVHCRIHAPRRALSEPGQ